MFYRHAGSLLSVLHLLGGSVFTMRNVITGQGVPIPLTSKRCCAPLWCGL
jgi:hypothetical protein